MPIKLRAPHNYDPDQASLQAGFATEGESLTQQHQAQEADINVIVKRFNVSGVLPIRQLPPLFGDFSEVFDFHSAQQRIREANEAFMALPPEVRARFDNDPGRFVDFATQEGNADEMRRMGLLDPLPDPEPAPAPSPAPGA